MKVKILSLFLVVTLLLSSSAYIVSASSGYDIYHWYSDSDSVRRWTQSTLNIYVATSSTYDSLNVTNLKSYISTSMLSWYFVGRGISYVSNKSDANLVLEGITRAEATSMDIPTTTLGIAYSSSESTRLAALYYGGTEKSLYKIIHVDVYLIESYQNSTVYGATKTTVHEMGHALGYAGHYDAGNVMTTYYNDMSSIYPSTAEENHLGQAYW